MPNSRAVSAFISGDPFKAWHRESYGTSSDGLGYGDGIPRGVRVVNYVIDDVTANIKALPSAPDIEFEYSQ